jgi:hypothetical protein
MNLDRELRLPPARRHALAKTDSRRPHSRDPYCVVGLYRLSRDHIDQLLQKAIAGLLVDLPKRNALARGDRGVQGDGTGNEGELQKALPMRTRDHVDTPYTSSQGDVSNGCSDSRF